MDADKFTAADPNNNVGHHLSEGNVSEDPQASKLGSATHLKMVFSREFKATVEIRIHGKLDGHLSNRHDRLPNESSREFESGPRLTIREGF